MLATELKSTTLTEKDFFPSLKRQEPAVPGYWTIDELAAELQVTVRKVQYDIKAKQGTRIYKAGRTLLLNDVDALAYLWQQRHRKS